jgi:uncharacterized protein YjbI with pentapeptide repeats
MRFIALLGALALASSVHAHGSAQWQGQERVRIDLSRETFTNARINNWIFFGSNLTGVSFRKAEARYARFDDANLRGADLRGAKLERASLRGAVLDRATFEGADLTGADFHGAVMTAVDFRGARLARTRGLAGLAGSQLKGADLTGADLTEVDRQLLSHMDLRGVKWDRHTRWPIGFRLPR